jgi:hypothetical protein
MKLKNYIQDIVDYGEIEVKGHLSSTPMINKECIKIPDQIITKIIPLYITRAHCIIITPTTSTLIQHVDSIFNHVEEAYIQVATIK